MEIYLPTLEAKMTALVIAFRFIVFAIMVAGFIFSMTAAGGSGTSLFRPLAKAIVIVAALAYMDLWFPKVESVFLTVANYLDPGYNEHPTASADAIRESTTRNPEGQAWSWRHLNESLYQAVTQAVANLFIFIGTLISVPALILQYILRWLLYLLTPFMLALLMVPGASGISIRFFQQLLAILAWPVGFALTNLAALAIWTDFRNAVGATPASGVEVLYSPFLDFMGGILATIVIVVGTLATPVVTQALFAQGQAFTGASGNFAHIVGLGTRTLQGMGSRRGSSGAMLAGRAAPSAPTPAGAPPPPMGAEARPGI